MLKTAAELTAIVTDILRGSGVDPSAAHLVADSLVAANLRGVDSHGVQLLHYYIDQILDRRADPRATPRILSESGACVHVDGANALGQVVADACCTHGIRVAHAIGASITVARDSNHFGAAAYWARRFSDAGLIGLVFCNASPIVPPWQGKQGRLGTNPICMAVPGCPWLLDMATTTVAANRIFKAHTNGESTLPDGWAFDSEGRPTTSVAEAFAGLVAPLGGYKGSGLAMMVEMLSAVLSGGAMSTGLGGLRVRERPFGASQTFVGIDAARFVPDFADRANALVATIKATPPAHGYDEVLVANDPELRVEAERRASGIPIEDGVWRTIEESAARVGVQLH